ncbi:MAG TPA: hypothetical protein VMV79_02700, partial [Alphaproteobacteria bacterium]|nr:hypothetical protein [Alphaproteobacteria bacterium]
WRGPDGKILSPFAELFTVGGSARDALGITDKYLRGEDPYFDFISRSIFDEVKRLLQDAFCEPHSRYDEKQIDLAVLSTISAYCFYDYANIGDLREPLRNGSTEFLDGMRDDFLDFLESFQEKACRDSQPVRQNPHWQSRLPEPPGPYPTR